MNNIDDILKGHREYLRGIRTDRLIGSSDEQTKKAIEALLAEAYKKGFIDGAISEVIKEMKTLIAMAYVNAAINERVAQSQAEQLQPAATIEQIQPAGTIEIKTYNPQQTINGKDLQGN